MAGELVNGQMYGLWEAICGPVFGRWYCKCTGCGKHQFVNIGNVLTGKSTKCGSCRTAKSNHERARGYAVVGKEYGWWTVISLEGKYRNLAVCRCRCGAERRIRSCLLVKCELNHGMGKCLSCAVKEWRRLEREARISESLPDRQLFDCEVVAVEGKRCMVRCLTRGHLLPVSYNHIDRGAFQGCKVCKAIATHRAKYVAYSKIFDLQMHRVAWIRTRVLDFGKPVSIYEPWLRDLGAFAEYLASLPGCDDAKLTVDRIDNSKGYEPDNLRFVTKAEQYYNRTSSVWNKYKHLLGDAGSDGCIAAPGVRQPESYGGSA